MQKANFSKAGLVDSIEEFFGQKGREISEKKAQKILRLSFEKQESVKNNRSKFNAKIAKFLLNILGWKVLSHEIPNLDKIVFVLGHHTSRMDFVIGALLKFYFDKHALILISAYYFKNRFLSKFLIKLGVGPLINTGHAKSQAEQLVELLNQIKKFRIVICPEGSLEKKNYWHKGFYYIAEHSSAYILPVKVDYSKKEISLGKAFLTTDVKSDMDKLREFYQGSFGKYPELQTEVRLKNENYSYKLK